MLLARQALAITEAEELWKFRGSAYSNIGHNYTNIGKFDSAVYFYTAGMEIYKAHEENQSLVKVYSYLGDVYRLMGDFPQALEWLFLSVELAEEIGMTERALYGWQNIGAVYFFSGEMDKAGEYFQMCYDLASESGDSLMIAGVSINMANLYFATGRAEEAVELLSTAAGIFERSNDLNTASMVYNNLGALFGSQERYEEALPYLEKAVNVRIKLNDIKGLASTYNNMGNTYARIGKYEEGLEYLQKSLEKAQSIGADADIQSAYYSLADVYSMQKEYEKALQYLELYYQYKDTLMSSENQAQMAELATRYESEKKEKELAILAKDQRLMSIQQLETAAEQKQLEADEWVSTIRTRIAYGIFIFAVIAVFIIGLILYRSSRANKTLKTQKEEIAAKGVELQTAHQNIKSQREEIQTQEENLKDANQSIVLQKDQIEEKNSEILSSIRYAQRIQSSILPSDRAVRRQLTASFILFQPKEYVSGDFYWLEPVGDKVLFAAVDCTGHGIPGAFVSMVGNTGLDRAVKEFGLTEPAAIMDKLAEFLDDIFVQKQKESEDGLQINDGMDMTLCALDRKTNMLEYAGAKNPMYLVRRSNDPIADMEPKASSETHHLYQFSVDKQPVGSYPERKPFTNRQLQLHTGDTLYLFSDGYADQFGGPKGKKLKYSAMRKLLLDVQGETMQEQKEQLGTAFNAWKNDMEQIDDVIVFGVRI